MVAEITVRSVELLPIHPRWIATLAAPHCHIYIKKCHVLVTFLSSGLRSALLFRRIAPLFALRRALPPRRLGTLGSTRTSGTGHWRKPPSGRSPGAFPTLSRSASRAIDL